MLRFFKLKAENFFSFQSLEFAFASSGLHFIEGKVLGVEGSSNGAGKSSIFEALTWALFGRTLRNISADGVRRRGGEGVCEVRVLLSLDGIDYTIVRTRGKDFSDNSVWFVEGNHFSDAVDALPQVERATAVSEKIVRAVGMSFDVWKNTVCFAQGLPLRFLQMTDAERKKVFDEIFGMEWLESAAKRMRGIRSAWRKTLQLQTETLAGAKARLELFYKAVAQMTVVVEVARKISVESSDQDVLFRLQASLEKLEGELIGEKIKAENLEFQLAESRAGREQNFVCVQDVLKREAGLEGSLREQERSYNEKRDMVAAGKCPSCDRPTDIPHFHEIVRQLAEIIEAQRKELEVIRYAKAEATGKLKASSAAEEALFKNLRQAEGAVRLLSEERAALENKIKYAKEKAKVDVESLGAKVSELESLDRQALRESERAFAASVRLRRLETFGQFLGVWGDGFGSEGMKNFIVSLYLPYLNSCVNKYLGILSPETTELEFSLDAAKGKIDILISDSDDGYGAKSGGERRRLDLAILLGLRDFLVKLAGIQVSLQIFDEIFEGLDDIGKERAMIVFREAASESAVYVVSHDPALSRVFDIVYRVVKGADGISFLEGGN